MTIEWHSDALTYSDTIDFPINEEYEYRANLYDVGGIPHNQFNGIYEFVGGASNCAWQNFYESRGEMHDTLIQQVSPWEIALEGELIESTYNYSIVVSLDDDVNIDENLLLEVFVAEDSINALWSACDSWHMTRNVARAYLTMGEENQLPLTISNEGETQIFSGSFELSEAWVDSMVKLIAVVQSWETYEIFQANSGRIFNIPLDRDDDGIVNLEDNCPYDFNPGQEDLDGDLIGDICDPCNNLVFVLGNINVDANEDNQPIINVIDVLLLSEQIENPVELNDCVMVDILTDDTINQWDLVLLVNQIMDGGS